MKTNIKLTVVLFVMFFAVYLFPQKNTNAAKVVEKQDKKINVMTEQVISEFYNPEFIIKSRVVAVEDIALRAQVSSTLVAKNFVEGDFVKKGDILFQLDDRLYQSKLSQAKAKLSQALVVQSITEREFKRAKQLFSDALISQSEFDLLLSKNANAGSEISLAKAQLLFASTELSYTQIKAPFDGKISDSKVSLGELISPASSILADLVSISPIHVEFKLSESEFNRAKRKKSKKASPLYEVSLSFSNGKHFSEKGAISYVGNRIDLTSGTIDIQAQFANKSQQLIPGQYVELTLTERTSDKVLTVPERAIQRDILGDFVMRVNNANKVERQNIQRGKNINDRVIIVSGLTLDDVVITGGLQKINNDSYVNITQEH